MLQLKSESREMDLPKVCLLLWLALGSSVYAGRDNGGTEFIVGFQYQMEHFLIDMEIYATTYKYSGATVTITTPLFDPNFSVSMFVERYSTNMAYVPYTIKTSPDPALENKGVYIVSTAEITIYCVNKNKLSTDAFVALPVDVAGTEFYHMGYLMDPQLLVVGIENNTVVTIRFADSTRRGTVHNVLPVNVTYNGVTYWDGDTLTETINRFQTLFMAQWDILEHADFCGTRIRSDKPIAVITGNHRARVPIDCQPRTSTDHLTEMIPAVETWGREFITISTPDRFIGDVFRIVASEDNTDVDLGGGAITFTLERAGDYKELDISTGEQLYLIATAPVMVGMFSKTEQDDGTFFGDPSMSLLIPTIQFAPEYTYSTIKQFNGNAFNDKISLIAPVGKTSEIELDGAPLVATWEPITGTSDWVTTWVRVSNGSHAIYHPDPSVRYMAMASGTERWNSYAFIAGTRMALVNTGSCSVTSTVAGDTVNNDCDAEVDEEINNGIDDDGDGLIDEDLAMPPKGDGNWGEWSDWSTCSVSCEGQGTQSRTRECNNPAPSYTGLDCVGDSAETQACDTRHIACVRNGGWGTWDAWGSCSVSCGSGTRSRTRHCDRPAPTGGGIICIGNSTEDEMCAMTACITNGGWGTWDAWGSCSVTCGSGTRSRTRQCDRPAPIGGGICIGNSTEDEVCAMTVCMIDGGWGTWASWGGCSVTCGAGTWSRTRVCDRPPPYLGADCVGDDLEYGNCTVSGCSIDGGWGTWDAWGSCSVTCSKGVKERTRACDNPPASNGGANCVGNDTDRATCTSRPCSIDGGWGTWGSWGMCSVPCQGVGVAQRYRSCNRPQAKFGGADCVGDDTETGSCDTSTVVCSRQINVWEVPYYTTPEPVAVDGGYSSWSDWGECTKSCGAGVRLRTRKCNNPMPQGSGSRCAGSPTDEDMCNTQSCDPYSYSHGVSQGGTCAEQRGLFDCLNGIQCISIFKRCDCKSDCRDGSDESMDYAGCIMSSEQCTSTAAAHTKLCGWPCLLVVIMVAYLLRST